SLYRSGNGSGKETSMTLPRIELILPWLACFVALDLSTMNHPQAKDTASSPNYESNSKSRLMRPSSGEIVH
ncbi:MAG TPA: hypothetical protein P5526_30775, partial [Anaerolineae bacterium]|nr:hypothetical protein [Anaerolineae bacterium]